MLLKARSIRWVPQLELVSEEKAAAAPSRLPHQHRGFLNKGVGAAQASEHLAGAVPAKAQQQRRQTDGQVLTACRAGIDDRFRGVQCFRRKLWQDNRQYFFVKICRRGGRSQQFGKLFLNALCRNAVQMGAQRFGCLPRGRVDGKAVPRRKTV